MEDSFSSQPYVSLTDAELCRMTAKGDRLAEEALAHRYAWLVRVCARPYFLMGGDGEDLIQEGFLGLLNAIREYQPARSIPFQPFAETCIRNRISSAVRSAACDKHSPLNHYVSFETPLFDGTPGFCPTGGIDRLADPEVLYIGREEQQECLDALKRQLSSFEATILTLYLNGLSYAEIASQVRRTPKSVDNAVQRVRRKLGRTLYPSDISKD